MGSVQGCSSEMVLAIALKVGVWNLWASEGPKGSARFSYTVNVAFILPENN